MTSQPASLADQGRLVRRALPHADESLAGFILRVSELNLFERPEWILNAAGQRWTQLTGHGQVEAVARLIGAPKEALEKLSYLQPNGGPATRSNFLGHSIRRYHLNARSPKICPKCVAETGYCRAVWDLRSYVACERHRIRLIDRCGNCGQTLRWNRLGVGLCTCGAALTGEPTQEASESVVAVSRAIQRSIRCSKVEGRKINASSGPLANTRLLELLEMIHVLAAYGIASNYGGKRMALGGSSAELAYTLVSDAAEVLSEWPLGFYNYLDELREQHGIDPRTSGLSRGFGSFYSALTRRIRSQAMDQFRHAFEQYLVRAWAGRITAAKPRWWQSRVASDVLTRNEAAEFLSVAPQTVDVLLRNGEVRGDVRRLGTQRSFAVVDRASALAYRNRRANVIGIGAAAKELGVAQPTFRKLVDKGLIYRPAIRNPRLRKAYEVDRQSIRRLLKRIDKASDFTTEVPGISFHKAVLRMAHVDCDSIYIVKAMLAGRIRIVGEDAQLTGIARYRLSGPDVQASLEHELAKLKAIDSDAIRRILVKSKNKGREVCL